jgi:hypothetical protein
MHDVSTTPRTNAGTATPCPSPASDDLIPLRQLPRLLREALPPGHTLTRRERARLKYGWFWRAATAGEFPTTRRGTHTYVRPEHLGHALAAASIVPPAATT